MIAFRHTDPRRPFLWETPDQPPGRWHGSGEGPVHYLADTPDGAWAEFLRHEEIRDPEDVHTIRRALWAIEVMSDQLSRPDLDDETLTGGIATYEACRDEALRLRALGSPGLTAPSAALVPGAAGGWQVQGGLRPAPARDGTVVALFGPRPDLVGWRAVAEGRPHESILAFVRHLTP